MGEETTHTVLTIVTSRRRFFLFISTTVRTNIITASSSCPAD